MELFGIIYLVAKLEGKEGVRSLRIKVLTTVIQDESGASLRPVCRLGQLGDQSKMKRSAYVALASAGIAISGMTLLW